MLLVQGPHFENYGKKGSGRSWGHGLERPEKSSRTSFIHSVNIFECLLCARLWGGYWEPGEENLFLGASFPGLGWRQMPY